MNHYEALGVAREATPHEIRQAWMRLAKKYHPDHRQDAGDKDPWPAHIIRAVNDAYDIVGDAENRKKYDAELDGAANPLPPIDPPPRPRNEPYRAEEVPPPVQTVQPQPQPAAPADDIWTDIKGVGAQALDSLIEKGMERFLGRKKRRR